MEISSTAFLAKREGLRLSRKPTKGVFGPHSSKGGKGLPGFPESRPIRWRGVFPKARV
jgi:hypothetical protein